MYPALSSTIFVLVPVRDGSGPAIVNALLAPGVWGAVVNFERVGKKSGAAAGQPPDGNGNGDDGGGSGKRRTENFIVDVLVNCDAGTVPGAGPKQLPKLLPPLAAGGAHVVLTVPLTQVDRLSSVRVFLNKVCGGQAPHGWGAVAACCRWL